MRQCKLYRKSFPMTEIAFPAMALNNRVIAKWVTDHRVAVDVHSGEQLATAIAAGVRIPRLTLYADAAIAAVLDHEWLNLVGLHCEVGSQDHDFVSERDAIGHVIAEMAQVRRNHGVILSWLGLGGGRAIPSGDWAVQLPQLAAQIDAWLDDACDTLRFPKPLVVLSTGLGIVGGNAA